MSALAEATTLGSRRYRIGLGLGAKLGGLGMTAELVEQAGQRGRGRESAFLYGIKKSDW
jgi:hypothetical protein